MIAFRRLHPAARSHGPDLVLGLAVAVARLAFSIRRSTFFLSPDEPANLGVARWLARRGGWNMFDASTFQPGFGTLLAPLVRIVPDPVAGFRIALAMNSAIGGVSAVVLARLLRRLVAANREQACWIAFLIGVLPASLSASAHVWAEPLVTLSFLGTLHGLITFVDHGRLRSAALASLAAIGGHLSHHRLLPLVAVTVTIVVGSLAGQRRFGAAAWVAGSMSICFVASVGYARWVIDSVWEQPGEVNSISTMAAKVRHPEAVLDSAAGQAWYLLTTTGLVFGFGVIEVVRSALRPNRSRLIGCSHARLLLLTFAPLFATSIVFMAGRDRPDHLVYGRYNDAIAWPILAVGGYWLIDAAKTRRIAEVVRTWVIVGLVSAELAAISWLLHRRQFAAGDAVWAMIPGLAPLWSSGHVRPVVLTCVALCVGGLIAVVLATIRNQALAATIAAVVCVIGGWRTESALSPEWSTLERSTRSVSELGEASIEPDSAFVIRGIWFEEMKWVFAYQWALPGHRFSSAPAAGPGTTYAIGKSWDPDVSGTDRIVWDDPASDLVIWVASDTGG